MQRYSKSRFNFKNPHTSKKHFVPMFAIFFLHIPFSDKTFLHMNDFMQQLYGTHLMSNSSLVSVGVYFPNRWPLNHPIFGYSFFMWKPVFQSMIGPLFQRTGTDYTENAHETCNLHCNFYVRIKTCNTHFTFIILEVLEIIP